MYSKLLLYGFSGGRQIQVIKKGTDHLKDDWTKLLDVRSLSSDRFQAELSGSFRALTDDA